MSSKRTAAFIILYIGIIGMILFTYFYVQKYYSHEATHLRLDHQTVPHITFSFHKYSILLKSRDKLSGSGCELSRVSAKR